jgi:hypothetical protein
MNIRTLNGYKLLYRPDHAKAMTCDNWKGWVYEHIYVVEKYRKATLREDEVVHHLDGHKDNNRLSNLVVLTQEAHIKIHEWLDKNVPFGTLSNEIRRCVVCDETLQFKQKVGCCPEHGDIARQKTDRPSEKDLLELLRHNSYTMVAKLYEVSDNAVRKWVKKYGYDPKTLEKIT